MHGHRRSVANTRSFCHAGGVEDPAEAVRGPNTDAYAPAVDLQAVVIHPAALTETPNFMDDHYALRPSPGTALALNP